MVEIKCSQMIQTHMFHIWIRLNHPATRQHHQDRPNYNNVKERILRPCKLQMPISQLQVTGFGRRKLQWPCWRVWNKLRWYFLKLVNWPIIILYLQKLLTPVPHSTLVLWHGRCLQKCLFDATHFESPQEIPTRARDNKGYEGMLESTNRFKPCNRTPEHCRIT